MPARRPRTGQVPRTLGKRVELPRFKRAGTKPCGSPLRVLLPDKKTVLQAQAGYSKPSCCRASALPSSKTHQRGLAAKAFQHQ